VITIIVTCLKAINANEPEPDAIIPETEQHLEVLASKPKQAVATGCPFGFSKHAVAPDTPCEKDAPAEDLYAYTDKHPMERKVSLTNEDFHKGTYRIHYPGTYKLMEDIEFCPTFHKGMNYHYQIQPNPKVNGRKCEEKMKVAYPGMPIDEESPGDWSRGSPCNGPYHMGFFAAITVESYHKVTIDLNGHRIDMCEEFYYQQRFYAHIELNSMPFIPTDKKDYKSQGPTFFGTYEAPAHHVIIKNGVLGKSSHHGIHGNTDGRVTIKDLKIEQFEVGAIQLNGPSKAMIKNVDIGPSSTTVPVVAAYSQARFLMPYLLEAVQFTGKPDTPPPPTPVCADDNDALKAQDGWDSYTCASASQYCKGYPSEMAPCAVTCKKCIPATGTGADFEVKLNGKMVQFGKVVNKLKHAMVMKSVHADHIGVKSKVFANPSGLPDGSAVYGVVIHKMGAAAGAFGDKAQLSKQNEFAGNVTLKNVKIHDLKLKAMEIKALAFGEAGGAPKKLVDPVGAILNFVATDDHSTYADNSNELLDAQVAFSVFVQEHSTFKMRYQSKGDLKNSHAEFLSWAAAGNEPLSGTSVDRIVCGGDAMHHVNKGAVGLRAEFVKDLSLKEVSIKDVHNFGTWDFRICDNVVDSRHLVDGFMAPDSRGAALYAANITTFDVTVSGVRSEGGSAVGIQDFGHTTYKHWKKTAKPTDTVTAVTAPIHSQTCTKKSTEKTTKMACEHVRDHTTCSARSDCEVSKSDVPVRQCAVQGKSLEKKFKAPCSVKEFEVQDLKEN